MMVYGKRLKVLLVHSPNSQLIPYKRNQRPFWILLLVMNLLLGVRGFNVDRPNEMEDPEMDKRNVLADENQCKGLYDWGIYTKLEAVCHDCYSLYREPGLHILCSQNCFSTQYFLECLDVLTLGQEQEKYKNLISQIYAPDLDEIERAEGAQSHDRPQKHQLVDHEEDLGHENGKKSNVHIPAGHPGLHHENKHPPPPHHHQGHHEINDNHHSELAKAEANHRKDHPLDSLEEFMEDFTFY